MARTPFAASSWRGFVRPLIVVTLAGLLSASRSVNTAIPGAPYQAPLPPPPPMRYVPGMEEPLVAGGPVTDQENKALDAALKEFHDSPAKSGKGADFDDFAKPLLAFIAAHPQSNWNAALHTNLGYGYYREAYYSRAFTEFGQAWHLGRNATTPQAHIMIDRAVGELAKLHARVGHGKELEALFAEIGNRPIGGPGTELIQSARAGLWAFHHDPGISYLCGPKALRNVLVALNASKEQIKVADDAKSGPHGFTLEQLAALATEAGLNFTLIHREPGQPIPVPSIINWNVHHFAALTGMEDGRYELNDMTFGDRGSTVLSRKVIDAESSGYFLVPARVAAHYANSGWRTVAAHSDEAGVVYGMGMAPYPWPGLSCDCGTPGYPGEGTGFVWTSQTQQWQMTVARASPTTASLHLEDTPVGYRPQIGLPNLDTIAYNAREDLQPANLSFSNLSSKWSHAWQAYIQYDPTNSDKTVQRIAGGGGGYYYLNVHIAATGAYQAETPDNSVLSRIPSAGKPTSWVRNMPDGGKETYGLSNRATTAPAFMFLTEVTDAKGNTTKINYDSSFRVTSVVDAMGRSTTFTYGLTGYPLLITKITDPFGRTAQLTYDTSARLSSIMDPVGITSSFTYSPTETTFVSALTTPYGTSKFSDAVNPNDAPASGSTSLSLTLTDPLGYTDFLYFYQNASMPDMDPPATVPVPAKMPKIANTLLEWRNTYYWNKHAFAGGVKMSGGVVQSEDFAKAAFTHWFHTATLTRQTLDTSRQISSIKQPLENRVWFDYYGTSDGLWSGTLDRPTATGRVLDDGTTQLSGATYPITPRYGGTASPWPLTRTDAMGRETKYTYASNNIDLLTVQQKTSATAFTTIATYDDYNAQHEPQTYTGADGQVWNLSYNPAGQIATVTDPNHFVTTYNYDGVGRLSTIQNANQKTALTLTYDVADRVRTRADSEGYSLTYDYDNLDRVTKITYPDGTTDLYDYSFQSGPSMGSPSLELRKHTDRLLNVIAYDYDADRRLISVTEPIASGKTRTTSYDYWEDGTLKDITDANNNVTHWEIDIESRPVSKTDAYGTAQAQTEFYTYEATTSRLKSITDALGQIKQFTYAQDDSLTGITYSKTVNPMPNVSFTYDPYFRRVTSMTDGSGTTNYSYYPAGGLGGLKLQKEATPFTNGMITYTYDALSRLASRTVDTSTEKFAYDSLSRLMTHGTALGSFNIAYLGQTGQIMGRQTGAGAVGTSWGYDINTNDRRLKTITNSGATRSFNFTTTPENLITQIQETAPGGSDFAPQTWNYSYDGVYRLQQGQSSSGANYQYGLDPVDNITLFQLPGGSTSVSYNSLNQIANFGSQSYVYDKNGNVLDDGLRTYTWDAENRLLSITPKSQLSQKTTFKYDGRGRRIAIDATNGGGTTETRYLWCGEALCQARTTADVVSRRYYSEGEYLPPTGAGLYYSQDQLGSVRDVLSTQNGRRVASFDYDPYGNPIQSGGTVGTDFRYAGLFYDQQDGLYLANHRVYDPKAGRWLSRDPIGIAGDLNTYLYVKANPVSLVDSSGFQEHYLSCAPYDECGPGTIPHETCTFTCLFWKEIGDYPSSKVEDAKESATKATLHIVQRQLKKVCKKMIRLYKWEDVFKDRIDTFNDFMECYNECTEESQWQWR